MTRSYTITEVPITQRYPCYGEYHMCAIDGAGCWEKEACERATAAKINGVM